MVDSRAQSVLVVDDDPRLRHLVELILTTDGFTCVMADDGDQVLAAVREHRPDLVLLDLKMRRVSGVDALQRLRRAGEDVPVIILTAVGEESLILRAYEAGADDYVTKPFLAKVLLARIRAVLRRTRLDQEPVARSGERVGDVMLDPVTQHASINGRRVALSPTEYGLLRTLMQGVGRVFTPAELLRRVWGPAYAGQDEIVRSNIYRLRHKVEPSPSQPRYIRGRRGVGYYFAPDAK
jgi:DNA-binding response OmpR family regulator